MQIQNLDNLTGRQIENLFKEGKLNHLKDQRITSEQIQNMLRGLMFDMMKEGIIHHEYIK